MPIRALLGALLGALALVGGAVLGAGSAPGRDVAASQGGPPPQRLLNLPQWGADIRVSPPSTGTLNVRNDVVLAINPRNAQQVLASYTAVDDIIYASISGYAWSSDAGRTWAGDHLTGSWYGSTMVPYGEGAIGFDPAGTAYYAGLGIADQVSGYFVLTSTFGGPWSTPVPVVVSNYLEYRDGGRLVVDPQPGGPDAGSCYLALRYYSDQVYGAVQLYTSRNRGQTWGAPLFISDPGHDDVAGINLVAAADGSLYAAFAQGQRISAQFYLDHSTDGGRTWGADQLITGAPISMTGTLDYKGHAIVLVGNANEDGFLINNVPFIAAAPSDPHTVYVVWNDGRWDQSYIHGAQVGRHGDIAFTRTTDSGATWSPPVRLNDDALANGVDQFEPSIAIGPQGQIGVTWYDRRDDPQHFLYHLYYSQSTDGGLTWSPNQRVSDVPSDPLAWLNAKSEGNLLHYSGLVFGPDYVLPGWLDSRSGFGRDIYTDRGVLPVESATPTPSAPPPSATPPSASPSPSATPPRSPTPSPSASPSPSGTPSPSAGPSPSPTALPCALQFADVPPTQPFYLYIQWAVCRGIVSGYQCGGPGEPCDPANSPYFRPGAGATRGQLTKMVVLGLGWPIQTPPTPTFADVPAGQTFYVFVETAAAHGLISGYTCGGPGEPCDPANRPYFRPGAPITRGQLSKIIVAARGWGLLLPPTPTFADVPPTQPFYGWIERAAQKGVISGYTCGGPGEPCDPAQRPYFRAGQNATRGQFSKILYLALTQP